MNLKPNSRKSSASSSKATEFRGQTTRRGKRISYSSSLTPKSSRGVTLIELLVVLAILGIAMTLAGPSMFRSIDRFGLDSAGHQLVTTFRMARNEARLGQREILGTISNGELILLRGEQRLKGVKLPDGVEVHSERDELAYSFLASGQILGPERLELVTREQHRGVLILGPPPGTVHFEMER